MKLFYKNIILAILILLLSVSLGKTVYESFYSINDYNNMGCNGDTLDGCIKANGMLWCAKNCRNAKPTSSCNGDTWAGCLKTNSQKWCQDNCRDNEKNLFSVGLPDIL